MATGTTGSRRQPEVGLAHLVSRKCPDLPHLQQSCKVFVVWRRALTNDKKTINFRTFAQPHCPSSTQHTEVWIVHPEIMRLPRGQGGWGGGEDDASRACGAKVVFCQPAHVPLQGYRWPVWILFWGTFPVKMMLDKVLGHGVCVVVRIWETDLGGKMR